MVFNVKKVVLTEYTNRNHTSSFFSNYRIQVYYLKIVRLEYTFSTLCDCIKFGRDGFG